MKLESCNDDISLCEQWHIQPQKGTIEFGNDYCIYLITVIITDKVAMNYRKSSQRDRILEILRETAIHPTADWLYREVRKTITRVSRGTIYRNLGVLIELGLVQKLPIEGSIDRFEAVKQPHFHLICEKCGSIEDFHLPHPEDIGTLAQRMCSFKINRCRVDFFGVCTKCQ
jgi:Fur family transcriptional regulator, peroxide stress response regulator